MNDRMTSSFVRLLRDYDFDQELCWKMVNQIEAVKIIATDKS